MWLKKCIGNGVRDNIDPVVIFSAILLLILPQHSVWSEETKVTTMSSYGNGTFNGKPCHPNALDECYNSNKLPTLKSPNIPTTSKEVEVACNTFNIGMQCVESYSKACLNPKQRQQLKLSVRGAHETFQFLCSDEKFRAEFLSHAPCYKKISSKWDECAHHFIESLKKVDQKGSLAVCCIRLRFLQCVTELAHVFCSQDAERFLQKLAETLVTSNIKKNVSECFDVKDVNCSRSSGACSPLKLSFLHPQSMLISVRQVFVNNFVTTTASQFSYLLKLLSLERIRDWVWLGMEGLSEWVKCALFAG